MHVYLSASCFPVKCKLNITVNKPQDYFKQNPEGGGGRGEYEGLGRRQPRFSHSTS